MSSKFNVGRRAPFVVASLSFLLYWASLPPSWVGWAVFLVPTVWAATVFNPDFRVFVRRSFAVARQNGENGRDRQKSEKESVVVERENGENRRLNEFEAARPERSDAENAQIERLGRAEEKTKVGKKRRFGRTRRVARLAGRVFFGGEYRQYWTAAFCFWAATVVWISYPHPATTLGWLAASAYLAIYFPLFVAITRALAGWAPTQNASTTPENGRNKENGKDGENEDNGENPQVRQIERTAQAVATARNGENAADGKAAPVLTLKIRQTTQTARDGQTWQAARDGENGRNAQFGQKARTKRPAKRFELPLWLAAPVAWTAVEWLRNRGLGGFSFAGLSHSLYDFPQFIQIAEPFGEYGVGAAIVAIGTLLGTAVAAAVSAICAKKEKEGKTAVCVESANGAKRRKFDGAKWGRVATPLLGAGAIFGVVVGFGAKRIAFFDAAERAALESGAVPCRVALLQDATTYRFPVPDWQNRQVAETYLALAAEAGRDPVGFDVVVWPESCFDVFWDEKTTVKSANGASGTDRANPAVSALSASATNSAVSINSVNSANAATTEIERIERAEKSRALARSRRDAARLTERLDAAAILGTTALLVDLDAGDETTVFNAAVFAPRLDAATVAATVAALGEKYVDFNAALPAAEPGEAAGKTLISGKEESWGKYVDWRTPASTAPNVPNPAAFRLYGKRRLVICGEYIPGADLLPDWFPLKAVCADFSLARGVGPVVFPVVRRVWAAENGEIGEFSENATASENGENTENGENRRNGRNAPLLFAPHVCFESSIPHYVKEQVRELAAVGAEPDVLVCLSNDGWFRNGSQTDGHLATQVFRAVENRKPLVAATHGGFSAHIDQAGRVRSRGTRRETEVVAAEVLPVDCERLGKGALIGGRDLAETLALGCVVLGLGALVLRRFGRRRKAES